MNLRRSIVAAVALLAAPGLTACGVTFGAQTDQVYNPAVGTDDQSGARDGSPGSGTRPDTSSDGASGGSAGEGTDGDRVEDPDGTGGSDGAGSGAGGTDGSVGERPDGSGQSPTASETPQRDGTGTGGNTDST